MAQIVVLALVAGLFVAVPLPASTKGELPPGASRTQPIQRRPAAAPARHQVPAAETAAEPPVRATGSKQLTAEWPPGSPKIVGPETKIPDPPRPPGPMCRGCGPGQPAVYTPGSVTSGPPATLQSKPSQVKGFVPGQSRELPDKRTEKSTTFINPDGTKTLRVYSGPANVRDSSGAMVPIDTKLVRGSDGRYRPAAAQAVSFAVSSADPQLATMRLGDQVEAGFGLSDGSSVDAAASGSDMRYADVRPGADFVVSATSTGFADQIVLKSADAPATWRFPLRLRGLTPVLSGGEVQGEVQLVDAHGAVQAVIPPGYMVDSSRDPANHGDGARSNGVTYRLLRDSGGSSWSLEMAFDEAWLHSPARVFPVIADPTLRLPAYNDTFVTNAVSEVDFSTQRDMSTGDKGNGVLFASYVRIESAELYLRGKYLLGASLSVFTLESSCSPRPLDVYPVTEDWRVALSWPGPAYDASSPIGSATFGRRTMCGDATGWDTVQIDPVRLQQMENSGTWHGFTLRASSTDPNGFKRFATSELLNGNPFLDVLYSDEGADIRLDSGRVSPPVTPSTSGWLLVWVTNRGSTVWTPTNRFKLVAITTDASGREVKRTSYAVSGDNIYYGWDSWFWVELGPEPAGTYTLRLTMQDGAGRLFDDYYHVPRYTVTFSVLPESAPEVTAFWPPNNAQVESLRPTLWAEYYDADRAPGDPRYWFQLCTGGTPDAPTGCQNTGWIDTATWTVPAGALSWTKTAYWYIALYDGQNMTYLEGPYALTPIVAQPEITSHLASAGDDAEVAGLNAQVGNYSTEAVDVQVKVPGPALELRRTYNSQDPRTNGALGAGWSTPFDQRVDTDPDGSGNVVVTLASGRQVRFGRNTDGTFAPPPGLAMTLVRGSGTWTLRDPSGDQRVFDDSGRLTTVSDAYGRQQKYLYTSGKLSQVHDVASGRSLYVGWNGNVIGTVKTDAPTAGGAQPTWTYTYDAGRLAKVCSPLSAGACTQYQYQTSSHYRSIITDANPMAYYPFSETSGSAATNVVQRKPKDLNGSYTGVGLGKTGALAGTPDPAVSFDATKSSAVVMPNNLLTSSMALAVELWFQAPTGKYGVLYAEQDTALNTKPGNHAPALYVGTDGKLYGSFWSPTGGGIHTAGRVDDGKWHHIVLSVNLDRQDLYLDGQLVGTNAGHVVAHQNMSKSAIGNGSTAGWPAGLSGNDPFAGLIDDFAVYRHPLGQLQISAHYAARAATSRLTKVIEPGNITTTAVSYDAATGRVATMIDRNGAQWTLTQPVVGDGTRTVTISSTGRDAVTYTYDANHGGRIASRHNSAGTEQWWYDANGFVSAYADANGRYRWFGRDTRGNVVEEQVVRAGIHQFTEYGYYLNPTDPLDPRNDHLIWRSAVRNGWDHDPAHRIAYDLDPAGRTIKATYPRPAGATAFPVETNTFTTGAEAAVGGGTVPAGLLATSVSRLGGVTTYSYDAHSDLRRTVDPVGLITDYTYDLVGQLATRATGAVVDGHAITYGTWTTTYNAGLLPDTETQPGVTNPITGVTHTARTTYRYDDGGRVTEKTVSDTTGGDASRTWTYGYDALGRPHTATAPDGGVSVQDWNTAGDLARTVQPNGLTQEYRYDDSRRLIETAAVGANVDPMDPSATRMVVESRAYDPAGQVASVVDAMGRETAFTYFDDGLPATKKLVRRDATGNVTSSTLLAQYEYDYGGQLIQEIDAGGAVHDYDYDDMGDRYRETLDVGGLARTIALTYNTNGAVTSRTEGNGITFLTGRSAETSYLFADNGSQIDGAGDRYTDNTATVTYKFTLPADTTSATLNLEIDNQYLIQLSADNQHWTEADRETRPIRNGSNRAIRSFPLDGYLGAAKTVYVRLGDSQPADGWGAALDRVAVDFTRAGGQPRRTTVGYDPAGRQTSTAIANPGGTPASLVTMTNRDPRGLVTQVIDPAGATTTQVYDAIGNPVTTTGPPRTVWRDGVRTDGFSLVTTVGHNTFGEQTQSQDPYGAVSTVAYDPMGRPTSTTLPPYTPPGGTAITPVIAATYDLTGQPLTFTDPLGRKTTVGYDPYGRPVTKALPDPDGTGPLATPVWRYTYDRLGELIDTTDPVGAHASATYNELGYTDTSTVSDRVDGNIVFYTTTLGRDDAGRLVSEKSPLGHTTTHDYNQAGQEIRTTDPTGRAVETRYDALGHPTATISGGIRATGYGYDAAGRQVTMTSHTVADGQLSAPLRTSQLSVDALGRPVTATSAEGRITRYTYDDAGNRTSVTQPVDPTDPASAVTVQVGYDALGHQTRMVDGNGNATDFLFNDWGLRTAIREPATPDGAARTWTTTYDAAGQAVSLLAPGGVSQTSTYDGLGRITDQTGAGAGQPTAAKHTQYDPLGRITQISGPSSDETYTWGDRGLLVASSGPAGTSTFGYDGEANLISRTDPAGSTAMGYDAAGRPATVTDPLTGRTATFGYGPAGDLVSIGYGPGAPGRTLTLDDLGRLASDTLTRSDGAVAATTTYGYDRDDLLTSRTTTGLAGAGTNTYGHDGIGRLSSWTAPNGQQTTYGYDGAANRTTAAGPGGARTFSYDARNRLISATGGGPDLTNTWSARGTLETSTIGTATTRYGWDAFDRQISAQTSGHTDTYSYDALDRVAQRNGVAFGYTDLSNDAARAPSPAGDWLVFRAPDGMPMSAKTGTNAGQLLTADGVHGDLVAAAAADTGALSASAGYAPDGTVTASNGSLPLGFQGGWTDPDTGLVNAHARWYSPTQASFTTQDQLTLGPDPVTATNRYAYADADPVTLADPSGNCPVCVVAPAAAAGPPGWALIAGVALVGAVAFGVSCYVQGGCHMPSWGGGSGSSGAASSPFDGADGAKVRALANAHNANIRGAVESMVMAGASAKEILDAIRAYYPTDADVVRVTGTTAPPAPLPRVPARSVGSSLAALAGAAAAAMAAARAAASAEINARSLANALAIPWITPAPPIQLTISNVRPPEIALLPAGTQLQNTLASTAGAAAAGTAAIPSVLLKNSDGSDAQNTALAGTVAAAAAAVTTAGETSSPPPGDRCTPSDGGEWVDPNLINFSQRTILPHNYAELMRQGLWDWNRPGSALRVMEVAGQLVSYDNRRLDAAREVGELVRIERVNSDDPMPASSTGRTWAEAFKRRFNDPRNRRAGGCVPDTGLFDRPKVERRE